MIAKSSQTFDEIRRHTLKLMAGVPLGLMLSNKAMAEKALCCLENVEISSEKTGRHIRAVIARPTDESKPVPAIVLFHEWWGLNNQIKTVATELAANHGVMALAVDLYNGQLAETPDQARELMQGIDPAEATETCTSWINWLHSHTQGNGKIGTIGWCFGGGWSLNASIASPVDGTVIYYGNVQKTASQLASLKGPVLGHFAAQDQWINKAMVSGFEAEMAKAGKSLTTYWYDADHAFANPTGNNYDKADAQLAWQRTTNFLKKTLGAV